VVVAAVEAAVVGVVVVGVVVASVAGACEALGTGEGGVDTTRDTSLPA
jgi:hypothetical protein